MDKGRAEVGKVLLGLRGQPGAGNFLLLVQKKVTKEKDPPGEPPLVVVALCYSTSRAAVELARKMKKHMGRPRAQTVLAEFPGPPVLLGGSQGVPSAGSVEG